jgi:Spy/CpxP family protein refolding chaperone
MKLLTVSVAVLALAASGGAFQVQTARAADPLDMISQEVLQESCTIAVQRHPAHFPITENPGPELGKIPDQPAARRMRGPDGMSPSPDRAGGENIRAHEMMPPDPLRGSFMKFLALSAAQKKQIFLVILDQRETASSLQKKQANLHMQLHKAEHTSPFDEKAVRSITAKLADNEAEMIVSRVKERKRINEVLSPEQREMVKKMAAVEAGPGRMPPAGP